MIKIAESEQEYIKCFEVLSDLRPHLEVDEFFSRITRMSDEIGYKLVYLTEHEIIAVAGIRISEWLHTGKYIEIEELITRECERSKGYGGLLFDWILEYARGKKCSQVRLVSGVSRESAHKFYLGKGMVYEAKYFSINV